MWLMIFSKLSALDCFGLDISKTPYNFDTKEKGYQIGIHVGFGKMNLSSSNPKLYLGYLIEFSAGYSEGSLFLPFMYIGFSPNFILEIDQFIFKAGIYIDTSLIVTATIGFGFLLK